MRHTYVIGATGTGKSTLLLNMILQDMKNGEGIAVLDPHGDLIDYILGHVPEDRVEDVLLFDPGDEEYPIGFNILLAHSGLEKTLLTSDLASVFKRFATSWGDQMTAVLGNAVLAFLESNSGGSLLDLRRFLTDPAVRKSFLKTVSDPEVIYFWEKEFSMLRGQPQASILIRLNTFLRPKLIRNIVGQKENRIDFRAVMDEGKIFLAKLAQGAIGEENAYLLGTLLVSKLHQSALSRQELAESKRRPLYLYIDEFQNFITPSMASILSGARKYGLGLILAHQEFRQLWSQDTEVASSVISNPYTRICFRLGDFDAQKLREGFRTFESEDLQNLGIGEAICRIERAEFDFNLNTYRKPEVDQDEARQRQVEAIEFSRQKYARRRGDVEAEIGAPGKVSTSQARRKEEPTKEDKSQRQPATDQAPAGKRKPRPSTLSAEAPSSGRGGQQHRYLQKVIKRWAEGRGYEVKIEKKILDGLGSVDVALETSQFSVACEISVTSTTEQEVKNIQKCLAAGFDHAVLISSDKQVLSRAREAVAIALNKEQFKQVGFFVPEELFSFLMTLEAKKTGVRKDQDLDSKELLTAKEVEKMLA